MKQKNVFSKCIFIVLTLSSLFASIQITLSRHLFIFTESYIIIQEWVTDKRKGLTLRECSSCNINYLFFTEHDSHSQSISSGALSASEEDFLDEQGAQVRSSSLLQVQRERRKLREN